MKQLTCEMCGSTDLVKDGGVFVCQSCGCKYSVEEAKRMMVEGIVNVQGTVKVDNSEKIANYLRIAKNALDANNHKEADEYANKILETEPHNAEAWLIKGEAVGWQTTNSNDRLQESVNAWINAVQYVDDEQLDDYRSSIATKSGVLYLAVLNLKTDGFSKIHDDSTRDGLLYSVRACVRYMNQLATKAGIRINRGYLYSKIADELNSAAVNAYMDANKSFGPEKINKTRWEWERYVASCDRCISVLQNALHYARTNEQRKTIYENLISIDTKAKDSCSYTFDVNSLTYDHYVPEWSLTQAAKIERAERINKWTQKKKDLSESQKEDALAAVRGKRDEEERNLARTKYWEDHADEKRKLEEEKAQAQARIASINQETEELPALSEIAGIKAEVVSLAAKQRSLGIFKNKERAMLKKQIAEKQGALAEAERKAETQRKPLLEESDKLAKRIESIEAEFSVDRGRIAIDSDDDLAFPNAIVEGEIAITAKQLAAQLDNNMPNHYSAQHSEYAVPSFNMSLPSVSEIMIKKDGEQSAVHVYCYAKDSEAPIDSILIELCSSNNEDIDMTEWIVIGSNVLCALSPDAHRANAEDLMCSLLTGTSSTMDQFAGVTVEYASEEQTASFGGLLGEEAENALSALGITIWYQCALIRSEKFRTPFV